MKRVLYFSLALLLTGACKQASDTDTKRVVLTGIDSSKKPGDDFFSYANHIWYDTVQIPASQAGVGSYSFLNYPQRILLQGILDSLSRSNNTAGSIAQKVGDFYASAVSTQRKTLQVAGALRSVIAATGPHLDGPAIQELEKLARQLTG